METRVARRQEIVKRAKEEIERKTGKTAEQLYQEREKRLTDAVNLKEPDRVPVAMRGGYMPLRRAGLSHDAAFYDHAAQEEAVIRALLDFEPDVCHVMGYGSTSGLALKALSPTNFQWPGGNLPNDYHHQWANTEEGQEYMREDEYDLFMTDPTDFMLRYYLPRVWGALAPFANIPTLGEKLVNTMPGFLAFIPTLLRPDFQEMGQTLREAANEQVKFGSFDGEIREIGFPSMTYPGGVGGEPFDLFASELRGMRGIMVDMYRRPEKLLAACERVLEWRLARAVPAKPNEIGRRVGGGAFHYSNDRFMSKKQFETFTWPTWKKALLTTIDMGFVPSPFCEAQCKDRLEYFFELPKGKVIPRFENTDMARAKAVLGNHCCIVGAVPAALLQMGSPQEVEECCKNLIKVCGKGGGFILDSASSLSDAKPANIKTMIDSAKKYGRY